MENQSRETYHNSLFTTICPAPTRSVPGLEGEKTKKKERKEGSEGEKGRKEGRRKEKDTPIPGTVYLSNYLSVYVSMHMCDDACKL